MKHPLDTQLLPSAAADHMLVTVEGGALGALVTARCTVSRSKDSSAGGTSRERLRVRPDRYCTLTTGARSSSTKRRGWTRVKLRWSSGCLAAGQRCRGHARGDLSTLVTAMGIRGLSPPPRHERLGSPRWRTRAFSVCVLVSCLPPCVGLITEEEQSREPTQPARRPHASASTYVLSIPTYVNFNRL